MKHYFVQTFGCQMNEYDSERIAAVLESLGMLPAEDMQNADLVILNTCSVREKPQHKVESYIGKLYQYQRLRKKPSMIGVMGCVAQQVGDVFLKKFPCVNFVLGTDSLYMLPEALIMAEHGGQICSQSWKSDNFSIEPFKRPQSITAYVTIMKGCNNFCSYCIVPYVRGREISRTPNEILQEITSLVQSGTKEITLLGQNVNSYGNGLDGIDFSTLLEQIAQVDGLTRIRFLTSHPKDFSMKLVRIMAQYPNICPFIHLPLQSGSDNVLKLMNRHYTWEQYYTNAMQAMEILPHARFSSDFITGFPGESENDFEKTMNAINTINYESIFAFIYSPRPGTKSAEMDDNVPLEEKGRRLTAILELQESINERRYAAELGKKVKVMAEGASKWGDNVLTGHTVYTRTVNFTSNTPLNIGDEIDVTITEVKRNTLFGVH